MYLHLNDWQLDLIMQMQFNLHIMLQFSAYMLRNQVNIYPIICNIASCLINNTFS